MSHHYKRVNKLICDWFDKISNFTQKRKRNFYVEMSMKNKNVHKIMRSHQKSENPFFDLNTKLKAKAENRFQRKVCKSRKNW